MIWRCPKGRHEDYPAKISNRTCLGRGCPRCNESRGEKRAHSVLTGMGLSFTRQYRFTEQKQGGFDFAVMRFGVLWFLLEIDGEHHFQGINYNSKRQTKADALATAIRRDNVKNELAHKHRAPLLRIPYTEYATEASIQGWIEHFIHTLQAVDGILLMFVDARLYRSVISGDDTSSTAMA
jgi:hypothetical protein